MRLADWTRVGESQTNDLSAPLKSCHDTNLLNDEFFRPARRHVALHYNYGATTFPKLHTYANSYSDSAKNDKRCHRKYTG